LFPSVVSSAAPGLLGDSLDLIVSGVSVPKSKVPFQPRLKMCSVPQHFHSVVIDLNIFEINFGLGWDLVIPPLSFLPNTKCLRPLESCKALSLYKPRFEESDKSRRRSYFLLKLEGNSSNRPFFDSLHKMGGETSDLVSEFFGWD
jgi:hypothetical protein